MCKWAGFSLDVAHFIVTFSCCLTVNDWYNYRNLTLSNNVILLNSKSGKSYLRHVMRKLVFEVLTSSNANQAIWPQQRAEGLKLLGIGSELSM